MLKKFSIRVVVLIFTTLLFLPQAARATSLFTIIVDGRPITCGSVGGRFVVGALNTRGRFEDASEKVKSLRERIRRLGVTARSSSSSRKKIERLQARRKEWRALLALGRNECAKGPPVVVSPVPTSSPTPANAVIDQPTINPTSTSTPTKTPTAVTTVPGASTATRTATPTPTNTQTRTPIPPQTVTSTPTVTRTPTRTATPTRTRTPTPTSPPTPDPLAFRTTPLTDDDVRYLYEKVALGAVPTGAYEAARTGGVTGLVGFLNRYDNTEQPVLEKCADYLPGTFLRVTGVGLQRWALCLLIESKNPFFDRMTFLFLHNLLAVSATSLSGTQLDLMRDQLELIRAYSIDGDYRELVKIHARQGATLKYLNLAFSTAAEPNEDYARELMQLYTLGQVNPLAPPGSQAVQNYNENDVASIALALAGHGLEVAGQAPNQLWSPVIRPQNVYQQPITVFAGSRCEQTFEGGAPKDVEVIDRIFNCQPVEKFLAYRILHEYLTEDLSALIRDGRFVNAFARRIRAERFNVRRAIAILLQTEEFWKPQYRNSITTSPVELVVSTIRRLGMRLSTSNMGSLSTLLQKSGHVITTFPSVFGYDNLDFADPNYQLTAVNTIRYFIKNLSSIAPATRVWTCNDVLPADGVRRNSAQVVDLLDIRMNTRLSAAGKLEVRRVLDNVPSLNAQGQLVLTPRPYDSSVAAAETNLCSAIELMVARNFSR